MKESMKTTFWVLLYSLMAGLSLALFAQIETFMKYIFSLLAIYIGIRFFKQFETIGLRVLFIVLAIIVYFLAAIAITAYFYIRDNPDLLTGMGH